MKIDRLIGILSVLLQRDIEDLCKAGIPIVTRQGSGGEIRVKAVFEAECKWRLVEEFGRGCFEEQADGTLLFHADYTDRENLITWLLTFGDRVRLLEPEDLREEMKALIESMRKKYEEE